MQFAKFIPPKYLLLQYILDFKKLQNFLKV